MDEELSRKLIMYNKNTETGKVLNNTVTLYIVISKDRYIVDIKK